MPWLEKRQESPPKKVAPNKLQRQKSSKFAFLFLCSTIYYHLVCDLDKKSQELPCFYNKAVNFAQVSALATVSCQMTWVFFAFS